VSKFKFFANPISAVAPKLDPVSVMGKKVGGQFGDLIDPVGKIQGRGNVKRETEKKQAEAFAARNRQAQTLLAEDDKQRRTLLGQGSRA
jgi:hypothetical protein